MSNEFTLDYTGQEINQKLGKIDQLSESIADQEKQINDLEKNGVAVNYDQKTKTLNISSGGTISENPEIGEVEKLIFNGQEIDLSQKLNKDDIAIGMHTDGLLYLFIDGVASGSGVALPSGGTDGDVVGYVDSDKNIVLTGKLEEGIYTLKYEMEDGTVLPIGNLDLSERPAYVNQIPISINETGSIYNGIGYKTGVRLSALSWTEKEANGYCLTGFIPYKNGDKIRLKDIPFNVDTDEANANYIAFYDANFQKVCFTTPGWMFKAEEGNGVFANSEVLNGTDKASYFRISIKGDLSNSIITINEPITE